MRSQSYEYSDGRRNAMYYAPVRQHSWVDEAPCRGMNPDLFFYEPEASGRTVCPEVCGSCPFTRECLELGVAMRSSGSWWGGVKVTQRKLVELACD